MKIIRKIEVLVVLCAIILFTISCKKGENLKNKPTLTTTQVNGITPTTATCGGNITADGGAPVTNRGVVWSTITEPTIATGNGIISNGSGVGSFISNLTDLTHNTTYYVRAFAVNIAGVQYGNQVIFKTPMADGPGATITDIDDNTYNTIWINNRQWIKENLSTTRYNDGSDIPLCTTKWAVRNTPSYFWYENKINVKSVYGALYNFYAVNTGKLCPTGWHVPTDAEWYAMENYVDSIINDPTVIGWRGNDGGTKLKSSDEWPNGWPSGWSDATDIYGFSGLPGGVRFNFGVCYDRGLKGIWWSSTDYNSTSALNRMLHLSYTSIKRSSGPKSSGYSVRCIKDN